MGKGSLQLNGEEGKRILGNHMNSVYNNIIYLQGFIFGEEFHDLVNFEKDIQLQGISRLEKQGIDVTDLRRSYNYFNRNLSGELN